MFCWCENNIQSFRTYHIFQTSNTYYNVRVKESNKERKRGSGFKVDEKAIRGRREESRREGSEGRERKSKRKGRIQSLGQLSLLASSTESKLTDTSSETPISSSGSSTTELLKRGTRGCPSLSTLRTHFRKPAFTDCATCGVSKSLRASEMMPRFEVVASFALPHQMTGRRVTFENRTMGSVWGAGMDTLKLC